MSVQAPLTNVDPGQPLAQDKKKRVVQPRDSEPQAMEKVLRILRQLTPAGRVRVVTYVMARCTAEETEQLKLPHTEEAPAQL